VGSHDVMCVKVSEFDHEILVDCWGIYCGDHENHDERC